MKTALSRKSNESASALMIALVMGGLLCVFIVYYLSLVEQQGKLGARSQAWNIAIAVSEAGVEEGLQHLNSNADNLGADGWTLIGGTYWKTNTLPDGNGYAVGINAASASSPEITSRAYVQLPLLAQQAPPVFFAAAGATADSGAFTRAVRVKTSRGNLFLAAMVAKHQIDLNGNGITTDSFDSSDPNYSENGQYPVGKPAKLKDNGDVASNDGIVNTIDVGNANIYGKAHTGAGGTISIGPNGGIGTHAWQATHDGVQDGYWAEDANFTFPDTSFPYTTGETPQPADILSVSNHITSTATNSTAYPNPPPWGGTQTNILSYTTVSSIPSPPPPGLTTNSPTYTTVSTLPSPIPAETTTNVVPHTVGSLPSPVPPGTVTNTTGDWDNNYPSPGTYVGAVVHIGNWYYYNRITGYSYSTYTYTYPTYTYGYPNYSYTYNLYHTNVIWMTNHYDNVLYADHKYVVDSLSGTTYIADPSARLVVLNGLNIGSSAFVIGKATDVVLGSGKVVPADCGVQIWSGGTALTLNGNEVFNQPGYASSFIIYCAPSVTSFDLNGNAGFTGVLVAPNVNIRMNGGGNNTIDFIGALMVNSVTMNGHFNFHYDEALRKMPNQGRFLITSWDEIP